MPTGSRDKVLLMDMSFCMSLLLQPSDEKLGIEVFDGLKQNVQRFKLKRNSTKEALI